MKLVASLKFALRSMALLILVLSFFAGNVNAQPFDPLEQVCERNPDAVACQESRSAQAQDGNPLNPTAVSAVNILSIVAGVIGVIIIIYAGITMTLSQGDSSKIKSSRDTIIYAVVGLIVVMLARVIVLFIVNRTA